MTSDTKLVERLRANLEIARDHGLSLPGEPAWMLEQERQQSAISALQNYESYLPQLLDALSSTHPTSDNRSEMVERLRFALSEMLRLADMGFEESLREPEESGNYAAYNRAKEILAESEASSR